jgi:putative flippase GtrA
MTKKLWNIKLFRFLCAGVINTIIDFTILNILVFVFRLPAVIANLVSASVSITISYFLNHHFVFRSSGPHSLKRFASFFILTGVGILAIQSLMIYLLIKLLNHHKLGVAQLITKIHLHLQVKAFDLNVAKLVAVSVAMVWNSCIYHFIIFKTHSVAEEQLGEGV